MDQYSRTRFLLGQAGMEKLRNARVAVFGLGGVGGSVVEALARAGVGTLELVDHDTVSLTNLNRQLLATHSTLGLDKTEAARRRVADIDPTIRVIPRTCFYTPDTAGEFDFSQYTWVVDAIDTVTGKLALIKAAQEAGVPILSCMGTGNKLDPTQFRIVDISKTSGCPLARIMRKECAKRGYRNIPVLFSPEEPQPILETSQEELPEGRRSLPGSVSFVPTVAGLIIAGHVIKSIAGI